MKRSRTRFAILALLRIEPMSGYEIRQFCTTRLRHFWNESFGQIYPTLTRLSDQGLIRRLDRPDAPRRATRYELTQKGRSTLDAWLREEPAPRMIRDELLLKLFCGTQVPRPVLSRHVAAARRQAERQLEIFGVAGTELETQAGDHPDRPYWRLILRAGELALAARLQWCAEAEALLEESDD